MGNYKLERLIRDDSSSGIIVITSFLWMDLNG